MVLLNLPVIALIILIGVCCVHPSTTADIALLVHGCAQKLGLRPETLLLLTMVVPILQALLLHSNRRHGIGGGRWIIYCAFFCAPAMFAVLYYMGVFLLCSTPMTAPPSDNVPTDHTDVLREN